MSHIAPSNSLARAPENGDSPDAFAELIVKASTQGISFADLRHYCARRLATLEAFFVAHPVMPAPVQWRRRDELEQMLQADCVVHLDAVELHWQGVVPRCQMQWQQEFNRQKLNAYITQLYQDINLLQRRLWPAWKLWRWSARRQQKLVLQSLRADRAQAEQAYSRLSEQLHRGVEAAWHRQQQQQGQQREIEMTWRGHHDELSRLRPLTTFLQDKNLQARFAVLPEGSFVKLKMQEDGVPDWAALMAVSGQSLDMQLRQLEQQAGQHQRMEHANKRYVEIFNLIYMMPEAELVAALLRDLPGGFTADILRPPPPSRLASEDITGAMDLRYFLARGHYELGVTSIARNGEGMPLAQLKLRWWPDDRRLDLIALQTFGDFQPLVEQLDNNMKALGQIWSADIRKADPLAAYGNGGFAAQTTA